jgi:hypothetical protein
MPQVPPPAPTAALNELPYELAENAMYHLSDANDSRALRDTCQKYRSYTFRALIPSLAPHMKQLRVLKTQKGLETLLALLSTPEWRSCIQCIKLVDPGVEALRDQKKDGKDDKDEYLWFGFWNVVSPQLETILDRVS